MNKIYRIIWSAVKEKWLVVSEKVTAKGCCPAATVGALTLSALLAAGGGAFALEPGALPTGGQITSGSASIATSGSRMTVNQSSQQMIANWNSFNIGVNAGVNFIQPNKQATALNRIQDQNPTQILGSLSANGKVFLLNPSGIIFGQSARVDVGGLVASSLNMLDNDFLSGKYLFSNSGTAGSLLNQGNITANGGVVALIAPKVTNEGSISTPGGSTLLAAGNRVSLDFAGDGLISYTVDQGAVDALVENKGLIKADGGMAVMTARAAGSLTQAVVNNSGIIEARMLTAVGGKILLDADGGTTTVSGTLDASSSTGKGGSIVATGERILLKDGALLTATGATGGGEVLVGGDWQGSGTLHQATTVKMEAGAVTDASATQQGDGGKVVLWSDVHNADSLTTAHGSVLAQGGAQGGNGGQVETSGHSVDIDGFRVDTLAPQGKAGLWLIDPYNYTIGSTQATAIGTALNTGNVTVTTTASNTTYGGSTNAGDVGSINVNSPITKASGTATTLTLQAHDRVIVNAAAPISGSSGHPLNVVLWANYGAARSVGVAINDAITTYGGHLWAGGSSSAGGSSTWNGLTVGNGASVGSSGGNNNALDLNGNISTGGGDVLLWGGTGVTGRDGIGLYGNRSISTGSGNLTLLANQLYNWDGTNGTLTINSTGNLTLAPGNGGAWSNGFNWSGSTSGSTYTLTNIGGAGRPLAIQNVSSLTGLTIGQYSGMSGVTLANTSDVTVSNAISVAGSIAMQGNVIYLNDNVTSTATGDMLFFGNALQTGNPGWSFKLAPGKTITKSNGTGTLTIQGNGRINEGINTGNIQATGSAKLNVVMISEMDGGSKFGVSTGSISTNGGHVWIGGGAKNATWNGLAVGSGPASASEAGNSIDLTGNITTNGGEVMLRAAGTNGIVLDADHSINAGSGNITLLANQVSRNSKYLTIGTTGTFTYAPDSAAWDNIGGALNVAGTISGNLFTGGGDTNWLKINNVSNLGGLVLGKEGNTSGVAMNSAWSIAGPISVYGGQVQVQQNLTSAGAITLQANTTDVLIDGTITNNAASATSLNIQAFRNIRLGSNASITSSTAPMTTQLWADSTATGDGILYITSSGIDTKGGDLTFGKNGQTASIGGQSVLVGGDVFFQRGSAQTLSTGGGSFTVYGQTLIGNSSGLNINSANGAVTFNGAIDSANQYTSVNEPAGITWTNAVTQAKSGVGTASGDTYLATVTSRLENSIASQTVGYNESWLGGRRVTGIGTDNLWRWVTGPEAAMDGGKGLVFAQQNTSGTNTANGATSVNGYFNNWSTNEPNNYQGVAISTENESVLQFTGNLGKWNDLPKTNSSLYYYVKETNAQPSPLTINAGSGALSIQGGVGSSKALASLNVTSGSTTVNGNGLVTTGAQTYSSALTANAGSNNLLLQGTTITAGGAVSATGADISLNANLTSAGAIALQANTTDVLIDGAITNTASSATSLNIQAARHIRLGSNASITSSNAAMTTQLWADTNTDGDGIVYLTSSGIDTHGGDLTFGQSGKTATIGGQSVLVGGDVFFQRSSAQTLSTGGGALKVYGETIVANTNGLTINTNNGDLNLYGLLNSGNAYDFVTVTSGGSWDAARTAAINSTGGRSATGDSYLATITSRLENSIAGLTANYKGAWIGAYRPDTNSYAWTWADGPEAGKTFFTQSGSGSSAGGGATSAGYYANFGTGEPNGNLTANANRTSVESVGQFFGSAGQWNDLYVNTTYSSTQSGPYNVLGYVRETNLAASPVTINAGTGALTIQGGAGTSKALASLNVTASSTTVNGNGLVTTGAQTYSSALTANAGSNNLLLQGTTITAVGAVNATGADISLNANLTSTLSGAAILAKASGSITQAASMAVSTTGGNVTYWADSDNNGSGNILLSAGTSTNNTSITTSGGAITLGGGTDPLTGYAKGANTTGADSFGVNLAGYGKLNAGTGTISLRGSTAETAGNYGIGVRLINSSSLIGGDISLTGIGSANTGSFANNWGVSMELASTITASGTLAITGTGGGGNSTGGSNLGIYLTGSTLTSSGAMTLTGTGGGKSGDTGGNKGVYVYGGSTVVSGAGAMTLIGTGGYNGSSEGITLSGNSGQTNTLGSATANAQTGAITLRADNPWFNFANTNQVLGTGSLTIEPLGTSFTSALTYPVSGLTVGSTLSGLTLGKDGNTANITVASATSIAGPIRIYGGNITLNAGLTATGTNTITLKGSGNVTDGASGFVSASNLLLLGGNVTLDNSTSNAIGTLAASGVSGLIYVDKNALTIGTVGSTIGVSASGAVSIGTKAGNLTVAQNVATTNAGTTALALNAGIDTAAGTSTGGNIIISGTPGISVGSGGRGTLYTGSILGSTGLADLSGLGSASGRFRYYSDETSTNYSTALSKGLNVIYREQPSASVTVASKSMTYGDAIPNLTGTVNTIVKSENGLSDVAITGATIMGDTPGYEVESRLNASSGNVKAGNYNLTETALAALGYRVTVTKGSLSVAQKELSLTGLRASDKTYNRDTAATVSSYGSLSGLMGSDALSLVSTSASAAFGDWNAGANKTVTVSSLSLNGSDSANYSIGSQTTTATINKAPLTLAAVTDSKVYDATTSSSGTVSVSGLVSSDGITGTLSQSFDSKNVQGSNGSLLKVNSGYTVSDGNSGNNYTVTTTTAQGTITPKALTLSGSSDISKTYNGTTSLPYGEAGYVTSGDGSLSGVIGNDTVSVTGSAAFNSANVARDGSSNVIAQDIVKGTVALSGADSGNYSLSWTNGSGIINPVPLTIYANNDAKFVTTDNPAFTVSYSGFVHGETANTAGVLGTAPVVTRTSSNEAANTYSGDLVASGGVANNYAITYQPGNFTIVGADQLLVRVASASTTYGTAASYGLSTSYVKSNSPTENITTLGTSATVSGTSGLSIGDWITVAGVSRKNHCN
jgi:filamentous hemagglutinin family protein